MIYLPDLTSEVCTVLPERLTALYIGNFNSASNKDGLVNFVQNVLLPLNNEYKCALHLVVAGNIPDNVVRNFQVS